MWCEWNISYPIVGVKLKILTVTRSCNFYLSKYFGKIYRRVWSNGAKVSPGRKRPSGRIREQAVSFLRNVILPPGPQNCTMRRNTIITSREGIFETSAIESDRVSTRIKTTDDIFPSRSFCKVKEAINRRYSPLASIVIFRNVEKAYSFTKHWYKSSCQTRYARALFQTLPIPTIVARILASHFVREVSWPLCILQPVETSRSMRPTGIGVHEQRTISRRNFSSVEIVSPRTR